MATVQIVKKSSEIDGKPIEWSVLQIIASVNGETLTLELKTSKTEALMARMLLASNEQIKTEARKASEDELDAFFAKQQENKNTDLNLN